MPYGWQQIRHKDNGFSFIVDVRYHLFFGMSVCKENSESEFRIFLEVSSYSIDELKLSGFLHWQNVFGQERSFFSGVRFSSPFPVVFICPIGSVFKSWDVSGSVFIPIYTSSAMVKVEVRHKDIGNIIFGKAILSQRAFQREVSRHVVIAEKLF